MLDIEKYDFIMDEFENTMGIGVDGLYLFIAGMMASGYIDKEKITNLIEDLDDNGLLRKDNRITLHKIRDACPSRRK